MSKGVIYCMTTAVPGLVKIGKAGIDAFEERMRYLESNGYRNVTGLCRHFAIVVEDYGDKELLIGDIFSKSRVGNTELFAIDARTVVQLLSSLEGKQIYPQDRSKDVVFIEAADGRGVDCVPEGEYVFRYKPHGGRTLTAVMKKEDGRLFLCAGSEINTERDAIIVPKWRAVRRSDSIAGGKVVRDIPCESPSMAGALVTGGSANGWDVWKTSDGRSIGAFRTTADEEE